MTVGNDGPLLRAPQQVPESLGVEGIPEAVQAETRYSDWMLPIEAVHPDCDVRACQRCEEQCWPRVGKAATTREATVRALAVQPAAALPIHES